MENGVKLQQNIKNPLLDIFPEKQNKTKQKQKQKKNTNTDSKRYIHHNVQNCTIEQQLKYMK